MQTTDSIAGTQRSIFLLHANEQGEALQIQLLKDALPAGFAPQGNSVCHDQYGNLYVAGGSRGKQVIMRTDTSYAVAWAQEMEHHECYAVLADDTSIYALAQNESLLGAHDFSLIKTDTAARSYPSMMFGTADEEIPETLIREGEHFVMAGRVFHNGSFQMEAVKVDAQLDKIWGQTYQSPSKGLQCASMAASPDGGGYFLTGKATGGADSVFLARLDTAGNPIWIRFYGLEGATTLNATDIIADPLSGALLICGNYRGPVYDRAFVLKLGATGDINWAKAYGPQAENIKESLEQITLGTDGHFYAIGNRMEDSNFVYTYSIFALKASILHGTLDCDSLLLFTGKSGTLLPGSSIMNQPFQYSGPATFTSSLTQPLSAAACTLSVSILPEDRSQQALALKHPVPGLLTLEASIPAGGATITMTNLLGHRIFEQAFPEGPLHHQLYTSTLANGIYMIWMTSETLRTPAQRILIHH